MVFVTTFSFSQQDDFSLEVVWVVLLQAAAASVQLPFALLVTCALPALPTLFFAEDLPSPACADASEARLARVKQRIIFFITLTSGSIDTTRVFNTMSGTIVKADPPWVAAGRFAFRCKLNADAMSFCLRHPD